MAFSANDGDVGMGCSRSVMMQEVRGARIETEPIQSLSLGHISGGLSLRDKESKGPQVEAKFMLVSFQGG